MRFHPATLAAILAIAPPLAAQQPDPRDTTRAGGLLEPIQVRAAADSQRLPLSRTSLGARELRLARTAQLDDALAGVGGVFPQARGSFALDTRLVVRGAGARAAFGTRGITVLLDGVPQTLADGQANLAQLDLGTLERVDIVRGAAAALYGNAAGGVVSAHAPAALGAPFARLRMLGGSEGTRQGSLAARARLGAGGAVLTASEIRQDGWRDYSSGVLRQASAAVRWPAGPSWQVGARVRVSDLARAQNPGALDSAQLAANPRMAQGRNVAFDAGKRATEWQFSADASRFGERGELSAVVFGLARDLDNPLPTAWVILDRAAVGARVSASHGLGGRALLLAGLDVQQQRDQRLNFSNDSGVRGATALVDQRETVLAWGVRAAVRAGLAPRTSATAGVRYDHVRFAVDDRLLTDGDATGARAMDAVSFTAALEHARGPWRAHASVGSAFETPTTTELARPGTGGFNAAVRPQRAVQAEGRLAWDGGPVSVALTAYRTTLRDGLVPREEPTAPGRFFFVNAAKVRLDGLEAELLATPRPWLRAAGTLTVTDHHYVSFPTDSTPLDGRRVPGAPRWGASARLTAGGAGGAFAEAELVHAGRAFADDANSASAAPWTLVHLRAAWRAGRLSPFAGVRNAFDARAVGSLNVNGALRRFYEPSAGRMWYVGLEVAARGGLRS